MAAGTRTKKLTPEAAIEAARADTVYCAALHAWASARRALRGWESPRTTRTGYRPDAPGLADYLATHTAYMAHRDALLDQVGQRRQWESICLLDDWERSLIYAE